MIETLLGSLLGGVFRMVPEVLKWLDRKDERKHELAMFDNQLKADTLKIEAGQKLAELEANKSLGLAEIQGLIAGVQAQAVKTGIRFIDGLSALMRPLITFWWVIVLYTIAIAAQFILLLEAGVPGAEAVVRLWGVEEKAIVSSIIGFWFVDRTLRKSGLK